MCGATWDADGRTEKVFGRIKIRDWANTGIGFRLEGAFLQGFVESSFFVYLFLGPFKGPTSVSFQ